MPCVGVPRRMAPQPASVLAAELKGPQLTDSFGRRLRGMEEYDGLYVYTMGRKNFILQHVVDANIAQTAPAVNPPSTGIIFALVGLYLHVELGFTGTQVQNAHMRMAKAKRAWPDVAWPRERGNITAATVLAMAAGQVRDKGIDDWCREVWAAFSANRNMVASLTSDYRLW